MTDDFGIWEVDEATKAAHPLEEAGRASTEMLLEDVFVETPTMLMPGLKLVGRQLQTANGPLDLLGVDSEGRLVVFELKREKLRRDAVAQAVDYASWLDSLDDAELHRLIAENSGRRGIAEIEDFEAWYGDNDSWESLELLRPVKIVLVGLGADEAARRMAEWLVDKGAPIELLTFFGYRSGERMLLARQVESSDEARKPERRDRAPGRRTARSAQRLEAINVKADEYGMRGWWQDAAAIVGYNSNRSYRKNSGITFYNPKKRTLPTGVRTDGTHKIEIVGRGVIRIIFFPAAVDLCFDNFQELEEVLSFERERPPNATTTERVSEQWFCRLDEAGWREHRDRIAELVRLVDERWREAAEQPPP